MTSNELEMYGLALFGASWQAQLANELNVDRRRVQDWLKRGSVPGFVDVEIKEIIAQRYNEIRDAMNYRDNYRDEVNKKIESFKSFYGADLKPGDVIACKLEEVDHKGQREEYIVTLKMGKQAGSDWQYLKLDEANYIGDLVHLDQKIKGKLDKIFAEVRES